MQLKGLARTLTLALPGRIQGGASRPPGHALGDRACRGVAYETFGRTRWKYPVRALVREAMQG
eukprot:15072635-Alexandrium_andersonii.AAC.1